MTSLDPFVLQGQLVTLEPLEPGHVDDLVAAACESRLTYSLAHVPHDRNTMAAWVDHALSEQEAGRHLPFVIRWRASSRVLGSTRFHDLEPWQWPPGSRNRRKGRPDAAEIGSTWLAESAQRTGANVESKLLLMTHAFEVWEVHRVRFRTDERNARSRRAIEGLGAHFDGVLRADKAGGDDTVRNSAFYSILASEWPSVKARLLERLQARAATAE